MYPFIDPAALYQEYQARVANAERTHQHMTTTPRRRPLQQGSGPGGGMRRRIGAWLSAARIRPLQHRQPEEGYSA